MGIIGYTLFNQENEKGDFNQGGGKEINTDGEG